MDEIAIGKKYNLSERGLQSLYEKLRQAGLLGSDLKPVRRRVNLVAVLADIRSGMSQTDLARKYQMSEEMVRRVCKKLLDARGTRAVSDGPVTLIEEPLEFLATREFVRHDVDFEVPVYEASRPEIQGMVRDISEQGVSVAGIEANVGDIKTLVVLGDEFGDFSSFEFEGYCRWIVEDPSDGTYLTGFSIQVISEDDLVELRKLVQLVMTG
jgi:hypothetical protein